MKKITVEITVESSLDKVWEFWTEPKHITKWAFASDDWESPYTENDVKTEGKFLTRMSAKDGSTSFDFNGVYTKVIPKEKIEYTIEDGRTVSVEFKQLDDRSIKIIEEFEMENENSEELQIAGWQAILGNFKKYVEGVI